MNVKSVLKIITQILLPIFSGVRHGPCVGTECIFIVVNITKLTLENSKNYPSISYAPLKKMNFK